MSPTLQEDSLSAEPQWKPKNTGVSRLSLLQWIFPTQELNWGLLHCRWILYQLSYQESLTHYSMFIHIYWGPSCTWHCPSHLVGTCGQRERTVSVCNNLIVLLQKCKGWSLLYKTEILCILRMEAAPQCQPGPLIHRHLCLWSSYDTFHIWELAWSCQDVKHTNPCYLYGSCYYDHYFIKVRTS